MIMTMMTMLQIKSKTHYKDVWQDRFCYCCCPQLKTLVNVLLLTSTSNILLVNDRKSNCCFSHIPDPPWCWAACRFPFLVLHLIFTWHSVHLTSSASTGGCWNVLLYIQHACGDLSLGAERVKSVRAGTRAEAPPGETPHHWTLTSSWNTDEFQSRFSFFSRLKHNLLLTESSTL